VLICPAGLWLDDHPVVDLFAALPFELPGLLLHDPEKHGALLSPAATSTTRSSSPNFWWATRGASAWRASCCSRFPTGAEQSGCTASRPHAVIWGASDRLIDPVYADAFARRIAGAETTLIEEAGHMVPYEQTGRVVETIVGLT
jgi:pimeloyl-ACP methyl ester carboxylesterase